MGNEIDHKKVVGEYVTLYESLKNISCPTICKTIDGATYIARMHFNSTTKTNIEDDVDLSGREIVRFGYKNTEHPVDSWITMMSQMIKILHAEDKSVLTLLAHTDNPDDELNDYVSDDPSVLRGPLEIDQNIYLERNTSTNTKLSVLRKFFKAYGQNPEELVFYLKDQNEDQKAEEAGTRFETRRKYWALALEYIKSAHGAEGSFRNVTTSKQYWINGAVGISGFSIVCEAKMKKAAVELVLGKTNRDINKSAFDFLFARKEEIEARFTEDDKVKYRLQRGDLLICEGGDVGRSAIWDSDEEMYYQNALHRVRFYGHILPQYFKTVIECYKGVGIIDEYSKGMTIKHLVQNALYAMALPLPPLAEQKRIVAKLEEVLPLCDGLRKS